MTDAPTVRDRVRSLVTGTPFYAVEAPSPFTFATVPVQLFDQGDVVRVETRLVDTVGLLGPYEERTDDVTVLLAAGYAGEVEDTLTRLHTLASSVTAAVIRDGAGAGDYAVPDGGRSVDVVAPEGARYAVLRLTVPVSYIAAL